MLRRYWVVLFAAVLMFAAEPQNRSAVEGYVVDDLAGGVSGVRVGLDNLSKGVHSETLTNASGYFTFDQLEPGGYSLWAEVPGHGCIVYPRIAARAGERVRQNFRFGRSKKGPENCEPFEKTSN